MGTSAPEGAAGQDAGADRGALAPFAQPIFLAIWTANVASSLGGQIQQVGTSWLMTSLAPTPQMIALVSSAITAPIFFFSLIAGAVADVVDRRKVLLAAQCFMFLVSAGLSLLSYAGAVTPALLLFATFLLFSGFALNAPAWQALVGELVPRFQLSAAIALNTLGLNLARTVGPALGGLVVGSFGPQAAFAFNAISYTALIVVLLAWRRPVADAAAAPEPVLAALGSGLRFVVYAQQVRPILLRAFAVGIGVSAVTALTPAVVRDLLRAGPLAYGTMLTCSGIGAVAGAAVSHTLRVRLSYEGVSRLAITTYAAGILIMAVSRATPLTGLAMFLTGAAMVLSLSTFSVAVQSNVPQWVAGRAISIYQMAMFGGMTLGSIVWGQVAGLSGLSTALLAAGIGMALTLLLGWRWPIGAADPRNLAPVGMPAASGSVADGAQADAPLTVIIGYRIPAEAVPAFLDLMRERRRIRLRDGARRWSLLQEADDPTRWLEQFGSRSSGDYLRHRDRRTAEDHANADQIHALDISPDGPTIRFLFERQANAAKPIVPLDWGSDVDAR
jgi:predicted MFS family arabinose efflux permease